MRRKAETVTGTTVNEMSGGLVYSISPFNRPLSQIDAHENFFEADPPLQYFALDSGVMPTL